MEISQLLAARNKPISQVRCIFRQDGRGGTTIEARAWYVQPFYIGFFVAFVAPVFVWAIFTTVLGIALFFAFPLIITPLLLIPGHSQVKEIVVELCGLIEAAPEPST